MQIIKAPELTQLILTMEDWLRICPPARGILHWKDKRSAKELARFWVNKTNQSKFINFISEYFKSNFEAIEAYPEYNTRFDSYPGNTRQNDLLITGKINNSSVVVSIEAKADESYGEIIGIQLKRAIDAKLKDNNSKSLNRIFDLWQSIGKLDDQYFNYRYQLFYWIAGTLSEAQRRNCTKAICISQIFNSDTISKSKRLNNDADLNRFLSLLSNNKYPELSKNEIVGPSFVKGNNVIPNNVELYIGKYETKI